MNYKIGDRVVIKDISRDNIETEYNRNIVEKMNLDEELKYNRPANYVHKAQTRAEYLAGVEKK